jgi:hypothetical protein
LNSRSTTQERALLTDAESLQQLHDFYKEQKQHAYPFYDNDLVVKLHQILYPDGAPEEGSVSDEALRLRIRRWRECIRITYRAQTHVGQNTEFDADIAPAARIISLTLAVTSDGRPA